MRAPVNLEQEFIFADANVDLQLHWFDCLGLVIIGGLMLGFGVVVVVFFLLHASEPSVQR